MIVRVNREKMYADTYVGKESIELYTGKVGCIEVTETHLFYYKDSEYAPPVWTGNSSRHGQKGTIGYIVNDEDMPYNADGSRPDIVINACCIPSRMTIGQLKETLMGKILIDLGILGDGSPFSDEFSVDSLRELLLKRGFEENGDELMYNGQTGEQH